MCTATHTALSLCVCFIEMYRAACRVPKAIKSIFQQLHRCCRDFYLLLWRPVPEGRNGGWERWRVKGRRLGKMRPRTGEEEMACRNLTYLMDGWGWEKKARGKKKIELIIITRCMQCERVLVKQSCQILRWKITLHMIAGIRGCCSANCRRDQMEIRTRYLLSLLLSSSTNTPWQTLTLARRPVYT